MTSYQSQAIHCAACEHPQKMTVLGSTNRMGSPDLDLRPPSMERETLSSQVQCCAACGYCAPDIAVAPTAKAAAALKRPSYRDLLQRKDWPITARQMACWGVLEQAAGHRLRAGWAALKAAWACDDAARPQAAQQLRELAADRFERAMDAGEAPFDDRGLSQALLADIWRRAGRFDMAMAWAGSGLAFKHMGGLNRRIEDMLRHQITLAEQRNDACHTIAQAERAAPDWPAREAALAAERAQQWTKGQLAEKAERERLSPRAMVGALADMTPLFAGPAEAAAADGPTRAERIRPWLENLPLPTSMAAIMEANVRGYGWPVAPTLAAFGLATLDKLEPLEQQRWQATQREWHALCEGHGHLLSYLHWCLRDAKALEWHYSPPQRSGEGVGPPRYQGDRVLG